MSSLVHGIGPHITTVPSGPSSALRRPEIQSEEEEEAVEEGQPS